MKILYKTKADINGNIYKLYVNHDKKNLLRKLQRYKSYWNKNNEKSIKGTKKRTYRT